LISPGLRRLAQAAFWLSPRATPIIKIAQWRISSTAFADTPGVDVHRELTRLGACVSFAIDPLTAPPSSTKANGRHATPEREAGHLSMNMVGQLSMNVYTRGSDDTLLFVSL
jgi:hypothetical protein